MTIENPIRIAIIEDIKEVALELQDLFDSEEGMSCKQIYYNAEDAIHFLSNNPVDIVITDIGLPRADGIDAIIAIRESCPQTQFCMFTVFEDNDRIFRSLQAGAKGYILKNADPDEILSSVKDLHLGGSPMNSTIARKVIDAFAEAASINKPRPVLPVTAREQELLELLSKGLLYKEIASSMGITVGTVKQHIHKIYDKLQVNNRTEAINKYLGR